LRAAAFGWITRRAAALSIFFTVATNSVCFCSAVPSVRADRNFFNCDFSAFFTALLRSRRFAS